jgi:vancomycin resistance protein YoaR
MGIVRRRALGIAIPVLLALVGGTVGATAAAQDVVMPGVLVGGVVVEGLSESGLRSRLASEAKLLEKREITLKVGDLSWDVRPIDLGIRADISRTSDLALGIGRKGPLEWVSHMIRHRAHKVSWMPRVDIAVFRSKIQDIASEVRRESSGGHVQIVDGKLLVAQPTPATALLVERAEKEVLRRAFDHRPETISLPYATTPPSVSESEVARAEAQVNSILEAPIEFTAEDKRVTLRPEAIAPALLIRPVFTDPEDPTAGAELVVQADPAALSKAIEVAAPSIVTPPKDASYVVEGDGVRVVPGEDGTTVDGALAAAEVTKLRHGGLRAPIPLTIIRQTANFKTEEALALGVKQKIQTFTTTFDPTNTPRVRNINLMAHAIDGVLVKPGEIFSLNKTTGPREPENGFQEAQIILDGELVPGVGGGVCQFGTTLFNTLFFAGLEIKERHNHSLYISHYPVGRDATVYYGALDLRFRNDTPYGILLKAGVGKKSLTISIYSSPLDRNVTYETSSRRNPKSVPTKYVDDPTLPAGQEVVEEGGQPGFDITVVRVVKQGEMTIHKDTFVSKYRSWKRIIRRGTGAPAPGPSSSPSGVVPAAPA